METARVRVSRRSFRGVPVMAPWVYALTAISFTALAVMYARKGRRFGAWVYHVAAITQVLLFIASFISH